MSIIANNGLCINPNVNLVSNIGFDDNATHTFGKNHPFANTETHPLIDIKHPISIERSMFIDEYIMKSVFGVKTNQGKRLDKLINTLAWLIPVRKWRDSFRNKVKE